MYSFLLGYRLGVELLDHMETLSFRGTARLFSIVAADLGWERNGGDRSGE